MIPLVFVWAISLQDPERPETVHFVMWKPHQPEAWDRLLADFRSRHPKIRVEVEVGPHSATELHTLLVTKLRNRDESLDAFLLDVVWPTEFAKAGYLEPVDDVVSPEERKEFFPGTVEACTVEGRLMAVPFNIDAGVLYYRKDLLESRGLAPPVTWKELAAQAERIVKEEARPGLVGYTAQFDRYEGLVCNLLEIVASNGGSLLDLDDPRTREAIAFVRDRLIGRISPRAVLNQREPQSRAAFLQGEAVFHRNWPSTWAIANDPKQSAVAGRVGMAPLPAFEGGRTVSCLGGWQLGVAAHSGRKGAAKAFVRFLASYEGQRNLTLQTSQTHSRMRVMRDREVVARYPHFAELRPILESAVPRPKLANYHEESDRLQAVLYREISGGSGASSWLPAAAGVGLLLAMLFLVSRGRS